MLSEPECFRRNCRYYIGVDQPDGTELTEVHTCPAFPKGIPEEIAYGDNKHLTKHKNQVGDYVYEPGESE